MIHVFCLGVLLLYPFLKFVFYQKYPLFTLEISLVVLGVLATVAIAARFVTRPLAGACVYACASAIFGAMLLQDGSVLYLVPIAIGAMVLGAFFYHVPKKAGSIVAVFCVGMLLSEPASFFLSPDQMPYIDQSSTVKRRDKPLQHVVYLILDEHIGIDGMPPDLPGTASIQTRVKTLYEKYGFTLYPRAYSSYSFTEDAIPNLLNNTYRSEQNAYLGEEESTARELSENALFSHFTKANYDIHVYQTNFMDFCVPHFSIERCDTYDRSLLALRAYPFSLLDRLWVVGSHFIATTAIYKKLDSTTKDRNWIKGRTGPLEVIPTLFSTLERDIRDADHDTLFFAHILMPHFPYVYDQNCRPQPVSKWENRADYRNARAPNSRESYERKYALYYEQMHCLTTLLDTFFASLNAMDPEHNMQIVVHGDHGSRITEHADPYFDFKDDLTDRDMLNSYSTLLAIRLPGDEQGSVDRVVGNAGDIVAARLLKGEAYRDVESDTVFLRQKHGKRTLVPVSLPAF